MIRLPQIRSSLQRAATVAALCSTPSLTWAHSRIGQGSGFLAGLAHPLTGVDHLLAMLAVGMWGAQLRGTALWLLPVVFPLLMALGAVAGILALPMLPIEPGIAASVFALGTVIALNYQPPLGGAVALVSLFAIFHGYAHGLELPRRTDALSYCIGFVLATGSIHLCGIGLGQVTRLRHGAGALRLGGAAIACVGLVLAGFLLVR